MSFLAVLFAVAALDAPASEQAPQSQAPAATTVQEATVMGKAAERPICHTEPVTGSHFDRRVCETPTAAKLRRQDLQQALQRDRDQRPYDRPPPTLDGQ